MYKKTYTGFLGIPMRRSNISPIREYNDDILYNLLPIVIDYIYKKCKIGKQYSKIEICKILDKKFWLNNDYIYTFLTRGYKYRIFDEDNYLIFNERYKGD